MTDVGHKDFSVTDTTGARGIGNGLHGRVNLIIAHDDFKLQLRQEVDDIFCPALEFSMPLLPAKALGFNHSHALKTQVLKRFFDFVELERLDNRFDLFHKIRLLV